MRLRASFVVENAFIAPLFTLIIAALMSICLYIRDSIVVENGILIASMKAEQEIRKNGQANEENKRIVNAARYYGTASTPALIYEVPKPDNLPEMLQKVKKEMEEDEKNH